jgi:hypothetical protein
MALGIGIGVGIWEHMVSVTVLDTYVAEEVI